MDWIQLFKLLGGAGVALYIMWRAIDHGVERLIKAFDRQTDAFTKMADALVEHRTEQKIGMARMEGKLDALLSSRRKDGDDESSDDAWRQEPTPVDGGGRRRSSVSEDPPAPRSRPGGAPYGPTPPPKGR